MTDKFNVILFRPRWSGPNSIESIDEIDHLRIDEYVSDNTTLLFFPCRPIFKQCLELIESWGFTHYTYTFMTTFKVRQLLLICNKSGGINWPNYVHAFKRDDNKFFKLIEDTYEGPYLYVYGDIDRPGWTCIGLA